jgi:hypothetical protein
MSQIMEWRLYQQKKVTMANEHTCSFSLDNLSFENSTLIFTANNKLKLSTPQGMKLSIKLDELRGYNRENRTLEIVRRPGQANVMIHFQSPAAATFRNALAVWSPCRSFAYKINKYITKKT